MAVDPIIKPDIFDIFFIFKCFTTVKYKHSKGFVSFYFQFRNKFCKYKTNFVLAFSPYYAYTMLPVVTFEM